MWDLTWPDRARLRNSHYCPQGNGPHLRPKERGWTILGLAFRAVPSGFAGAASPCQSALLHTPLQPQAARQGFPSPCFSACAPSSVLAPSVTLAWARRVSLVLQSPAKGKGLLGRVSRPTSSESGGAVTAKLAKLWEDPSQQRAPWPLPPLQWGQASRPEFDSNSGAGGSRAGAGGVGTG